MLKVTCISIILISIGSLTAYGQLSDAEPTTDHYQLHSSCANLLNDQVGWELYASIVYMNMGGYFDRPSVARKGYARLFREQSLEEYEHASKFVEYINKRNATVRRIAIEKSPKNEWSSPKEALSDAIKLEKHVYTKIQHIHNVAEQQCLDAHLTDFLESYFFTEQVDSIRDLQEKLTKLDVEEPSSAELINYLEDARMVRAKSGEL